MATELQQAYWKKWYAANKARHIKNAGRSKMKIRRARQAWLAEQKDRPCTDCGVRYPAWVMQFDHVRGEKVDDVARMACDTVALQKLKEEVEKCEVVCANCHADRTHKRRTDG